MSPYELEEILGHVGLTITRRHVAREAIDPRQRLAICIIFMVPLVSMGLDLFLYLVPCLAPLGRRSVCILRQTETQPAECCNTLKPRIITQTQCCLPQIYVRCHRKCTLFLETISRSLQQRAVNRCRGSTLCLPHALFLFVCCNTACKCLYVAILHASVCMLQHCMQMSVCYNTGCKCSCFSIFFHQF